MPDVSGRSAVVAEVERFQGHLLYLNEELTLITELLAVEGEGRKRIPELCTDAKGDLRMRAEDLGSFRERYHPDARAIDNEALVLAATCAPPLAMEISALDLFVDALTVADRVRGDDVEFVDGVLRTARSVYNSQVSFVHSALILQGQDLLAYTESYGSDPGTVASREAFTALADREFPQFRTRVLERSFG